jgi:hypothetical protein
MLVAERSAQLEICRRSLSGSPRDQPQHLLRLRAARPIMDAELFQQLTVSALGATSPLR